MKADTLAHLRKEGKVALGFATIMMDPSMKDYGKMIEEMEEGF